MLNATLAANTAAYTTGFYDLVAASATQGKRTVANLRLKLLTNNVVGDADTFPFAYTV